MISFFFCITMSIFLISFNYSFFFNDTATTEIYTLSLHDALPICLSALRPHDGDVVPERLEPAVVDLGRAEVMALVAYVADALRSEEHTSELQSPCNLVCRPLLVKKKSRFLNDAHN